MSAHPSHLNQHRVGLALALALSAIVGCGQSQPAEKFPSPGEAVGRLESLSAEIQQQFEAGTPKKAHDAMHDIGRLLLTIGKSGFLEQLEPDARDEVKQAAKQLLDVYTKIDGAMFHGGDASEAPEYSELQGDIDAALATFFKHVPESERKAAQKDAGGHGHDHDHGDHDHGDHDHGDHDSDHDHGDHAEDSHADDDDHDHEGHDHSDHDDHDEGEHSEDGHSHDDDSAEGAASEATGVEPPAQEPVVEQPPAEEAKQ